MKISDLDPKDIHVGLRFKSLTDDTHFATIVAIRELKDADGNINERQMFYKWDHKNWENFFEDNDCECEIVG